FERYMPETGVARPRSMIAEFKRATLGELDFIREAGNISKMQRNFAGVEHIEIAEVFWKLTTARVITMTKMEGLGVWDKQALVDQGIDPKLLVERGLGMFLQMVFIDGLFHGDLHPGNVLAMPGTRVGIIDLGVTVHLG